MALFGSVGKWLGKKLVKVELGDVLKGVSTLEELLRKHEKFSDLLKNFLLRQRGPLGVEQ